MSVLPRGGPKKVFNYMLGRKVKRNSCDPQPDRLSVSELYGDGNVILQTISIHLQCCRWFNEPGIWCYPLFAFL